MGRFSSVQAYTDSNANARTVSYEQAAGSTQQKGGVVKPEKVVNPYGSAAGAGSGEFHVYRHARSRELERMQTLKESEEEAKKDEEFQKMMERNRQEELERTEKLRKKRQRRKEAKQRKKNLAKAGVTLTSGYEDDEEEDFTYEPAQSSSEVAAPGTIITAERGGEPQTDLEDGKPPGDVPRVGEPTKPKPTGPSVPAGEGDESATKDTGAESVVRENNDADADDDDDDDDDDESVGPQPEPKRSKS